MKRTTKLMAVLLAGLLLFALIPATAMAHYFAKSVIPRLPGVGTLVVTDADGAPVAGAKYDLYRVANYGGKDTKIGETLETDKNGKILVSHLTYGDFYWAAAEEVEGFAPDAEKHVFKIVGTAFVTTKVALALPEPEPEPEPVEEEAAIAEEAEEEAAVIADEAEEAEEEAEAEEAAETEKAAVLGGWNIPADTALTEEVIDAFEKAMEGLLGVDYTPVAYLGYQVVAGLNHAILCEASVVIPDAEPYYAIVYIYEDLEGNAEILQIVALEEGDVTVAEDGTIEFSAELSIAELAVTDAEAEDAEAPAAEEAAEEAPAAEEAAEEAPAEEEAVIE